MIRAERQNGPQTKGRPQRGGLHLSGPQTETGSEEDNSQKAGFGKKKRRTGAIRIIKEREIVGGKVFNYFCHIWGHEIANYVDSDSAKIVISRKDLLMPFNAVQHFK